MGCKVVATNISSTAAATGGEAAGRAAEPRRAGRGDMAGRHIYNIRSDTLPMMFLDSALSFVPLLEIAPLPMTLSE